MRTKTMLKVLVICVSLLISSVSNAFASENILFDSSLTEQNNVLKTFSQGFYDYDFVADNSLTQNSVGYDSEWVGKTENWNDSNLTQGTYLSFVHSKGVMQNWDTGMEYGKSLIKLQRATWAADNEKAIAKSGEKYRITVRFRSSCANYKIGGVGLSLTAGVLNGGAINGYDKKCIVNLVDEIKNSGSEWVTASATLSIPKEHLLCEGSIICLALCPFVQSTGYVSNWHPEYGDFTFDLDMIKVETLNSYYDFMSSYIGGSSVRLGNAVYDVTGRYVLAAENGAGISPQELTLDNADVSVTGVTENFSDSISYDSANNKRTFGASIKGYGDNGFLARACLVLKPHSNDKSKDIITHTSKDNYSNSEGDGTWNNGIWSAQLCDASSDTYTAITKRMNNGYFSEWAYGSSAVFADELRLTESNSEMNTVRTFTAPMNGALTIDETVITGGANTSYARIIKEGLDGTKVTIWPEDLSVWPANGYNCIYAWTKVNQSKISNIMVNKGDKIHFEVRKEKASDSMTQIKWINSISYTNYDEADLKPASDFDIGAEKYVSNSSFSTLLGDGTWDGVWLAQVCNKAGEYTNLTKAHTNGGYSSDASNWAKSTVFGETMYITSELTDESVVRTFIAPRNGEVTIDPTTVTGGAEATIARITLETTGGEVKTLWGNAKAWPVDGYNYIYNWTKIQQPEINNIVLAKGDKIHFEIKKINNSDGGSNIKWTNTITYVDRVIYSNTLSSVGSDTAMGFIKQGYQLTWSDEFSGNALNSNLWRQRVEGVDSGAGSKEGIVILNNDKRVLEVSDGVLRMSTIKYSEESKPDIKYATANGITTGYIKENIEGFEGKGLAYRYGYLEMRAKMTATKGNYLSFWTQGFNHIANAETKLYTDIGAEVDIFEMTGNKEWKAQPNLWLWGPWNNTTQSQAYEPYNYYNPSTGKLRESNGYVMESNDWHTYGYEWTPEKLVMYYDGNPYMTYDITKNYSSDSGLIKGEESFHSPQDIILGISPVVVDTWGTNREIDDTSVFPMNFEVDYIRLYQKDGLSHTYPNGKTVYTGLWKAE